ncbi:Ig-like domain-containing protein [Thalassovita aquimarina]|nr:Ig-like domain-containing protein [Thalassovita aquimarina]
MAWIAATAGQVFGKLTGGIMKAVVAGPGLVAAAFCSMAQPARALDTVNGGNLVKFQFGGCLVDTRADHLGAYLKIHSASHGTVAPEASIYNMTVGAPLSFAVPVTASCLESACGLQDVTGLTQNGADHPHVSMDDYLGFAFNAIAPGVGRQQYEVALSGVTGTQLVNSATMIDPAPTVTLSGLDSTFTGRQSLTATFSEPVTGFSPSDIQVTNGTAYGAAASGSSYVFTLEPAGPGAVLVSVPAGAATDSGGLGNAASNTLSGTAAGASSVSADFHASPQAGFAVPHSVFFLNQSYATPSGAETMMTWRWDFGDGNTSTAQNPIHTYTSFGTYTATLETCVYATCDTQSTTIEVVNVPATMTPALSGFSGNVTGPQTVTVAFNAGVDAADPLQLSDFSTDNLTLSNLPAGTPSPAYDQAQTYTLTATPNGDGAVSLSLPAGVVANYRGIANGLSNTLAGTVDTAPPVITLVDPGPRTSPVTSFQPEFSFSADAQPNPGSVVTISGAQQYGPVQVVMPANTITLEAVPRRDGPVAVIFPAGFLRDGAGNVSAETRITLGNADVDEPQPVISGVPLYVAGDFDASVDFSKPVEGFTAADIQVTGGTVSSLSGSGSSYIATITPDGSRNITIDIPAEAAEHVALAGVPGVFSAAAASVRTFYNTAPVADAGPDQAVRSGTVVALDGSASADPDGDPIAFYWTAPSGITLGDPTVAQPSFTAPVLAPGDPDQTLTFSLAVTDGFQSSQDRVKVRVMADVALTLSGLPATITGPTTITADFSEDVTGFGAADISLRNLALSNFTALSASRYSFDVTPLARGPVEILVSAGAAQDADNNASLASNVLTATGFTNGAPVAYAGADRAVRSGARVQLDASGSSDPDGDTLTYAWSAPGGVTLDDPALFAPSFTAPDLAPGDPDRPLTFSLIVDDGTSTGRDEVQITVMAVIAASLAGLSGTVSGPHAVTATFSAPITGFDEGDLELTNLSLSGFTRIDGQTYSFTVAPLARGEVRIELPAGAAEDSRGNATAAAVLSATGFTNAAPVADAGPDQVTGGGVEITLDGSGSSDPDGDALSYTWVAPAGITLDDPTSAQPSFAAPALAPGDPDRVLDLTLTVSDGTESRADTVTVTLRAAVSVTLSGLPDSFTGPGRHTADILFSRAVTGFDAADLVVRGGEVQSLTGSGAAYRASIRASGKGDLTVSIQAGVVRDGDGIANAASNRLTAVNRIVEHTSELIAGFMQSRANNLIGNQPELSRFMLGGGGGHQLNAAVSRGSMNMDMALTPTGGALATLRGAFSEEDGRDTGYALASFGRHIAVRPNLLAGHAAVRLCQSR